MNKPESPCYECEQREIGCHSSCRAYNKFRKELDEYNATLRRFNEEQQKIEYHKKGSSTWKR